MSQATTKANAPISVISLEDTLQCAQNLLNAAQTLGFVYVTLESTGILEQEVENMFELSKAFFALPIAEKSAYAITSKNHGFSGPSVTTEILDPSSKKQDQKQAFNMGPFITSTAKPKPQQPLPPLLLDSLSSLAQFQSRCHAVCRRILSLFAQALEIPDKDFFTPSHSPENGPSGSIHRFLYYPPPTEISAREEKEEVIAGSHTDYGSLTLLFLRPQDTGLQIVSSSENGERWTDVPVIPNAICVNIGDLLSYWTAGFLKSTKHRVIRHRRNETHVVPNGKEGKSRLADEEGRYSIVYFCHPVDSTPLNPIPSDVIKARYASDSEYNTGKNPLTAEEHLRRRLAETYGWKEEAKEEVSRGS